MPERQPARQITVANAEFDVGQVRPQPGDDRAEAAVKMTRQKQVADDQVALACGRDEVASQDRQIVFYPRNSPGAIVVAELEIGQLDVDDSVEQGKRFARAVEIRLPDDRRQFGATGHGVEDRRQVNRRLAADTLQRACPFVSPAFDRLGRNSAVSGRPRRGSNALDSATQNAQRRSQPERQNRWDGTSSHSSLYSTRCLYTRAPGPALQGPLSPATRSAPQRCSHSLQAR
jgi:hypothetical protein